MIKLIISHENLDFDGLSSMIACKILYPDGVLVYSGKLDKEIKSFINLYKYSLQIYNYSEINLDTVDSLIIVDTNSKNRLGPFKNILNNDLEVTIFDHHKPTQESIAASKMVIKYYGSCTTILLKKIIKKNMEITPFQATLFLLGIYADTNCLTFKNTTYHDAEVVAFLFRKRADLDIVNEYLYEFTNEEQDKLLMTLLTNIETVEVKKYQIFFSYSEHHEYISGLSNIASKITHIKNTDALFIISKMGDKTYIVGRSLEDDINIAEVLEAFDGGGHRRAGSASVKNGEIGDIKERILNMLRKKITPQIKAKDIMSYPVKTLLEDMSVENANRIMLRYGHTGMPVVKDDKLIGIISRTDLDKAMIHDLSHAPIKGFMKQKVITIEPNTSINEINELLTKHNIGRLPVMQGDKIVGIVTRTNLLQQIHGDSIPRWYKSNYDQSHEFLDVKEKIHQLPEEIADLIETVREVAKVGNHKMYIVGGFVRDLLLNRKNFDLDFVVEGDAIEIAEQVNHRLKGRLISHEKFQTAVITLQDQPHIDFVSARREYYEYPAALPKVEKSTIWNDLFRRDFTINCMAIELNGKNEYQLIDYFSGLDDLYSGQIRALYNLSFIEDPTRIFRAVRFASRLNFSIEEETKKFILQAVNDKMVNKLSHDRIREEIHGIFKDENLHRSLVLMKELHIFKTLNEGYDISSEEIQKVDNIPNTLKNFNTIDREDIRYSDIIVQQLLSGLPIGLVPKIINNYVSYRQSYHGIIEGLRKKNKVYQHLQSQNVELYDIYTLLEFATDEMLVFYYNDCNNSDIKHYLLYYKIKLQSIHTLITGQDLLDLGVKPGPLFKRILKEVLKAKIQGHIYTKEDELAYAKKLYKNYLEMS